MCYSIGMFESVLVAYFLHQFKLTNVPAHLADSAVHASQLTVEIEQPSVHTIAKGAQRVRILTLHFSASCEGPVTVDSLDIRRRGLGESSDIDALYAMTNGTRLHRAVGLSRTGMAHFRFRDFTVAACQRMTVEILADFSPDAAVAGEHWFTVESSSDIHTNGSSVALLSPKRPVMQSTGGGPAAGTVAVEYLRLLNTVRYGENRTVARLQLSADGTSDHLIRSITLTNNGSARGSDLQNLYVRAGRNRRMSLLLQAMDGDTAHLVLHPPLLLQKNQKRVLEVQADIRASRTRTLQLLIELPSDIQSDVSRGRGE